MTISLNEAGPSKIDGDSLSPECPVHRGGGHIDLVSAVVSSVFKIGEAEILAVQRGKAPVAFARQVAMYLAHVALSHSLTEVGRAFKRDRTTVSHACQLVEDRREDPQIDQALEFLERSILAVAGFGCKGDKG